MILSIDKNFNKTYDTFVINSKLNSFFISALMHCGSLPIQEFIQNSIDEAPVAPSLAPASDPFPHVPELELPQLNQLSPERNVGRERALMETKFQPNQHFQFQNLMTSIETLRNEDVNSVLCSARFASLCKEPKSCSVIIQSSEFGLLYNSVLKAAGPYSTVSEIYYTILSELEHSTDYSNTLLEILTYHTNHILSWQSTYNNVRNETQKLVSFIYCIKRLRKKASWNMATILGVYNKIYRTKHLGAQFLSILNNLDHIKAFRRFLYLSEFMSNLPDDSFFCRFMDMTKKDADLFHSTCKKHTDSYCKTVLNRDKLLDLLRNSE